MKFCVPGAVFVLTLLLILAGCQLEDGGEQNYSTSPDSPETRLEQRSLTPPHQAIIQDNADAQDYKDRAAVYAALGQHQRAVDNYGEAIRLDSQSAEAYYARGFAFNKLGEPYQAIRDFNRAIQLEPTAAEP